MSKRILLTAALPYSNSPVHIGHLVEHFGADFWARYQRMQGNECHFLCADDTHGTPVMLAAREKGISPEEHVNQVWKLHTQDFADCQIEYAHYSSTNSQENKELCEYFYHQMKEKGHIHIKSIDQLYCEHDKMFLPDRFVKGTCPKCGANDQYGDNCDKCGATYNPSDMKSPYCSLCRNAPVTKQSDHILFKLNDFKSYLEAWLPQHTAKEVSNKMLEWFKEDLRDWDISRDEPYFGFKVPGYKDKYFYVWVDAPMGYISTTVQFCKKTGLNFDDFWKSDKTEVYHFVGKDVARFHTLFWPALLKTAGFRTPNQVFVHGHLTVNGEKMSKSKGTQIQARTYLNHLDPAYLRYYFACKLSSGLDDFDFSTDDFIQRVNSDLIGKITNLASRGAQMLSSKLDGKISSPDTEGRKLIQHAQSKAKEIADHYQAWDFAKAINEIRALADEANRYFDEKAPWKTLATDPAGTKAVLTTTLNIYRLLAIFLKPVLPKYVEQVEKLLNEKPYAWSDSQKILENHSIQPYQHLANRIDPEKVKAMMEESKPAASSTPAPIAAKPALQESTTGEIEIEAFTKVDLRIAKIIEAEEVKEADKLLKLKVDLGPLGTRQIFAGIKSAYKADQLIGRLTVVVANLKPRKMKFGMSEGMVLAAGEGGSSLFILSPDAGAQPGDKVK